MKKRLSIIVISVILVMAFAFGASAYIAGDTDNDFLITAADARFTLRLSVGLEECEQHSDQFFAADADNDGKITAGDARLILRASVGLEKFEVNTATHSYSAATCTTPAKCSCGATKGSALGHNFNAATCTVPKTCKTCGATEGSAVGHNWRNATCSAPKTCKTCGATEGSAVGHNWSNATCSAPKTCKTCGKTEGTADNHNYDNNGTCTKCGTVLPEATEYITFNDVFLENYVKQSLGIQGTNKVSKYAMSKLTSFDIGKNVTDVQDLKYATNLQSISINADNVKNLNVLCSLSKITYVRFGFDKNIDISFMKNMNNIESVSFGNANIIGGELSYLTSSPKLKYLYFYYTGGGGIDFLQGANALETLELWHAFGGNSDISVLKTLPQLKTLAILTYNSTSDAQRAVYAELMSKGVSVSFI